MNCKTSCTMLGWPEPRGGEATPAWYVLFVRSNLEEKVKKLLESQVGDGFQYLIPTRKLRERKGGQWRLVQRKLFPGYILVKGNLTVESYYKIMRIPDIIRFLKDEKTVLTLQEKELKVLNLLLDSKENTIGISTCCLAGDKILVADGPLVGLEGLIVSINQRKGRAKVRLHLANQEKVVELGIEVVQALPLPPNPAIDSQ